jgi:glycosyltransferase involved in cell wall biosynthesis
MPKVSVIIPTYNRASLIAQTLQSVLAQTFHDFEVIVIDDGSKDNTRDVIAGFKDPRIRYMYHENAGVAAARNTGIKASGGEYVSFLDSDDVLQPNALELSVAVLEKNPQTAFSHGNAYIMDEKQRVFGLRNRTEKDSYIIDGKEEIRKALRRGNHITTSTVLARRQNLEKAGLFDTSFTSGSEDFDLWVRLAGTGDVAYIAAPLIIYRMHARSISGTQKMTELEKNNSIIYEKIFSDPVLGAYFASERDNSYLKLYLRLADYAFGNREMGSSRKYLLKARQAKPQWFRKKLWLPLVTRFGRTFIPAAVFNLGHKTKRLVRISLVKKPVSGLG